MILAATLFLALASSATIAIAEDGAGFSTCTAKGNLIFAGGGFALGFLIGWLTGGDP